MIKVVHIINWLNYGGAEVMLCNLLSRTDRSRHEPVVVSLIDVMPLAARIRALGVPIHTMNMRPGAPDPRAVAALARLLKRERPDVVQGWMYHSNLIASLASAFSTKAPVVWGIHHTSYDRRLTKRSTLMTVAACARLSHRFPARIVCCSESARSWHAGNGFANDKLEVIPNGFDTDVFRPDPEARRDVRRELGLGPDVLLVGLAARHDPQKDHRNFFEAAARVAVSNDRVHFLLCGNGIDDRNEELTGAIEALGLGGRCHLLGPRRDMPRICAGLDLGCSSSAIGEALPLTLGEAMASGVPCVTTDVGDSALVVGPTGRVVPPRDPVALAAAIAALLDLDPEARTELGLAARRRIQERYDLEAVTRRYEAVYAAVHSPRPHGPAPASKPRRGGRREAMTPTPMAAGAGEGNA
jgi:glycosyltransferase involved in cell wall biosynthesis